MRRYTNMWYISLQIQRAVIAILLCALGWRDHCQLLYHKWCCVWSSWWNTQSYAACCCTRVAQLDSVNINFMFCAYSYWTVNILCLHFFVFRMRFMSHNWSATKQRLHLQSVAELSCHSILSGDRIRQCLATRTQISVCKSPFLSAGTTVSLFRAKTVQQRPLLPMEVETRLPDCGVTH